MSTDLNIWIVPRFVLILMADVICLMSDELRDVGHSALTRHLRPTTHTVKGTDNYYK